MKLLLSLMTLAVLIGLGLSPAFAASAKTSSTSILAFKEANVLTLGASWTEGGYAFQNYTMMGEIAGGVTGTVECAWTQITYPDGFQTVVPPDVCAFTGTVTGASGSGTATLFESYVSGVASTHFTGTWKWFGGTGSLAGIYGTAVFEGHLTSTDTSVNAGTTTVGFTPTST
jgi:hypothetical protein